ncbi:beta-ketoacyl synthase N-terminal-like domain-containing protein [Chamaesiphon sp. VAR_48_metabat_403]|uniref:beta-ketoacyl synthase N-terminal-like domain-containing protein n=1 Tax=Chamaesiphon sp. VAR_48_metabat_403 TaxID=2964700 RepID=UPI00286DFC2C|nr:beta-ketoacyl synthase N-terminal-like domain-containing protein [Chamaesiphon sp. VAR_48_metabat_403]
MRIVITGIGFRSALGDLASTWQSLIAGKSGIELHQPFADLPPLPLALIEKAPLDVITLTQMVVAEAVKDAGLSLPLPDCGVAIGSSRGSQAQWEKFAANGQDLSGWLDTLPHSPAIAAARYIGSQSALLAPMAACATGIVALSQAIGLMRSGACERAIAGAVEAPITPLTITGFRQMGALATRGCYPFDRSREGLVLGEAGAVFVLESATLAEARGAKIYGEVLGCGLTNDAYHLCAVDFDLGAAISAIDRSLSYHLTIDSHQGFPNPKSCLVSLLTSGSPTLALAKPLPQQKPLRRSYASRKIQNPLGAFHCRGTRTVHASAKSKIDYIHAHGTGTSLNDWRESQLIERMFPQGVPISSTKGATGHTLGASGAVGIALCLKSIATQILPPSVGLIDSEFDLDFVMTPRQTTVNRVLCLSFGFGGQNASILLQKWSETTTNLALTPNPSPKLGRGEPEPEARAG